MLRKIPKSRAILQYICLFSFFIVSKQLSAQTQPKEDKCTKIDTTLFTSSAMHWYYIRENRNVVNARTGHPRYKGNELIKIGDNILLYQQTNGGWPKNYDMQAILTENQKDSLREAKGTLRTTFDNTTTYSQIECLARIYRSTADEKYRAACLKGLDFTLEAQYPNGGWPQCFPLENNYSRYITFNDDVYVGIMKMLKDILDHDPCYDFIDSSYRKKVQVAFNKGLDCILKCQIIDNDELTIWAQQYDENKLTPEWARAFEPIALSSRESAVLVLFLMDIENPSETLKNAIQHAVKWFSKSRIFGIKLRVIKAPVKEYSTGVLTTDRIVVKDSTAAPIWPRYVELGTKKPLFSDRESHLLYSFSEIERERRVGYGWYTYIPQEVLDKYPEWFKKWGK